MRMKLALLDVQLLQEVMAPAPDSSRGLGYGSSYILCYRIPPLSTSSCPSLVQGNWVFSLERILVPPLFVAAVILLSNSLSTIQLSLSLSSWISSHPCIHVVLHGRSSYDSSHEEMTNLTLSCSKQQPRRRRYRTIISGWCLLGRHATTPNRKDLVRSNFSA